MHFTTIGRGIHPNCVVQGRPTPYLCTRKEGPKRRMGPKKYNIMKEYIHLIMQDWDPDWKIPTEWNRDGEP
jgi:hypothetical protein